VLVLDEIQKIPTWSETVKRLWDENTRKKRPLKPRLFELGCRYSGQILSYTKMLGPRWKNS